MRELIVANAVRWKAMQIDRVQFAALDDAHAHALVDRSLRDAPRCLGARERLKAHLAPFFSLASSERAFNF